MGKKNKKWNADRWQGRSKQQVENNNKILGYTGIIGFITLVAYFLYKLLDL